MTEGMRPHTLRAFDESTTYASPERRLMLATITNAIVDAMGRGVVCHIPARDKVRREALAWFRDCGPDFQAVCHHAGLDPRRTQRAVLAYIASGQPLPAMRRGNARGVRMSDDWKDAA